MRTILSLFLLTALCLAETMSINTPYRGELYDEVKPFMTELFKRNSYDLHYQKLPLKRGLINANTGIDDGDGPRVKAVGKKFLNIIRIDVPILEISIHAYFTNKNIKVNSWEDIKPYTVGVRTGTVIQVNHVKKSNPKEIVYTATNEKLFELLQENKLDIIISERTMAREIKKRNNFHNLNQSPPLLRKKMYLFLNKKHKNKVKGFKNTLLQMKEEGYQKRLETFYNTGVSQK